MLVCPEGRTQGQPDLLQSSSNIYVPAGDGEGKVRDVGHRVVHGQLDNGFILRVVGYAAEGVVRTF